MIGRLSGIVVHQAPPWIVVEVQGVGYELEVPLGTFTRLPAQDVTVRFLTHLVVREDAHLLYGFLEEEERQAFRQLLKISGVGPRLALAVLSGLSVNALGQAVERQEVDLLTRIPGIGKKTAQRLLLELKEKLILSPSPEGPLPNSIGSTFTVELAQALGNLGYNEREIQWAVKQLPAEDLTLEQGIRMTLGWLARRES
ncbi:MAG: Holliday junction branch migration protein RuvA [Ferrovum myxofaciens]|uniref:Holliday junction branch migration protein RuvA n=1 Tax=Ferrovum myxofaciens TaxID=416213 RepID=UPI002354BED4|nr:Holliday junction branch migration protein RuvA [Ferrovum myxofaciens]QKE41567.1 MAG: Holliday junction branch migration protein RuvA [Ferrovum myxofaciens]